MFACLHLQSGLLDAFLQLASDFSPHWEQCREATVLIPVYGLERLIGSTQNIAEAIATRAGELELTLYLAIAGNPDTALLAATNIDDITVIPPGREVEILGPLPIEVLPTTPDVIDTLLRWGIENLEGFAALPPLGVIERLGEEGGRLQALVEGRGSRPLRIARPPEDYTAHAYLDEPLTNSEPLLFLLSGMVHDIVKRLASHGLAVGQFHGIFPPRHEIHIHFPAPMQDPLAILKQVQISFETSRPRHAIAEVQLELVPTLPQVVQHGLFTPSSPEPAQIQTLLARLNGLLGEDHVGSPELLNTHRPDAWRLRQDVLFTTPNLTPLPQAPIPLAFRYFRPARKANVALSPERRPARVQAPGVSGSVLAAAGPWRSAGEWWKSTSWSRDEWDVGLSDGARYRLYRDHLSNQWFVEGAYD